MDRSCSEKGGLVRDLNPGPLAPKARIIPLDQRATLTMEHCWALIPNCFIYLPVFTVTLYPPGCLFPELCSTQKPIALLE